MNDKLVVKSHVARDLLQSAGLFRSEKLVVWEYVSNSLQYVDQGINPEVQVKLDSKGKTVKITDNGRGMRWVDLQNFFVMHGENIDRKKGAAGRGRFGTGKSAAFGIAETLRVTTVRAGKRSKVELNRSEIDTGSDAPIPLRVLDQEVPTDSPNGTVVDIEGIHLKSLDANGVIHYVERHLARWPRNSVVFINHHECEVAEPPVAKVFEFEPEGEQADALGSVKLWVKVSKAPLDEDLRGVSVFSKGVWHETTLAGNEGREMAQYIFGEIDVPRLDDDTSPISPFDMSRSMRLNPSNELVQTIHAFIGRNIDRVRRELVDAEKKRKEGEEAKKLQEQASEIASLLNEDFQDYRRKLAKARASDPGGTDLAPGGVGGEGDELFGPGGDEPVAETYPPQTDTPVERSGKPPELEPDQSGDPKGKKLGADPDQKRKPRGGFHVDFDYMGEQTARAQYVPDSRTIFINLDHPQIAAAKGLGNVEEPAFRRLAYEVAFAEYAVALASEMAGRDQYIDPTDPIVDIRDTINRLARKGSKLYAE